MRVKVVSLFSGIGGFEEAFKNSNIDAEVVFASEIDKFARKAYKANFPEVELHGDIHDVSEFDVPDHDLLLAGFPCQSFSITGKREGFNDIRGTLFFDIVRILKAKRPKYILLENVRNLVSHDKNETIKTILQNLSEIGYTIDFEIINSNKVGVPQNRERTYIVGVRNYQVEKYLIKSETAIINFIKSWANENNIRTFNFFNNFKYNKKDDYLVLEDIIKENDEVQDEFYFNNKKLNIFLGSSNIKDYEKRQNQILKVLDLPREVHNDLERQRRIYSIKGVSPTVLARSDSTKILVKKDNNYKIRKITPLENFLVQGFDKEFVDNIKEAGISNTQLYKQSGNAVSPPVITKIYNLLYPYLKEENSIKKFKFIDIFSGIGGFRLALESLGGECVYSSEIDGYAIRTYKENFNDIPGGDIKKVDEKEIPDHDVLCAGFPCQPFSIGGYRKGFEDTRGTLFFDVVRIVNEKKPKIVFLENVSGIKSHDEGNTLKVIKRTLNDLGYKCHDNIMNAMHYGVPQNRNRWYCVAIRNDIDSSDFKFPKRTELEYTVKDILESNMDESYKISEVANRNINSHIERFYESGRQKEGEIVIANEVRKSRCGFRADGISPCLTAKMGTGGNNVPIVVSEARKLTERECLALMGYPSWFAIEENTMQSYKQIGNSVAVPIIKKIANEFIKYF